MAPAPLESKMRRAETHNCDWWKMANVGNIRPGFRLKSPVCIAISSNSKLKERQP